MSDDEGALIEETEREVQRLLSEDSGLPEWLAEVQRQIADLPPGYIERRDEIERWIEQNATLVPASEWSSVFETDYRTTEQLLPGGSIIAGTIALHRKVWERFGLLGALDSYEFRRPTTSVPYWLLEACALVDLPPERAPRSLPRAIPPAFTVLNMPGVGQISSSQISEGLFLACVAPKEEWTITEKGFPLYTYHYDKTDIHFVLRPEVIAGRQTTDDVAMMQRMRDELSVADFDTIAAMMAQVLEERNPDGSAYMAATHILNYRELKPKKGKDGYSAGHQQKARAAVAESVRRLSQLFVSTDSLPILVANGRRPERKATRVNAKILNIMKDAEIKGEDSSFAWHYAFGEWFSTFLEAPNNYVAYIWQKVLTYHPTKQQWAKQLAYYLTIEIRKHANKDGVVRREIGTLLDGAKIATTPRFPDRTRDRLEDAIRTLVRDRLFRLEVDGVILDGPSPELDRWTAGHGLPARSWFGMYRKRLVTFRANPDIEKLYQDSRRRLPKDASTSPVPRS